MLGSSVCGPGTGGADSVYDTRDFIWEPRGLRLPRMRPRTIAAGAARSTGAPRCTRSTTAPARGKTGGRHLQRHLGHRRGRKLRYVGRDRNTPSSELPAHAHHRYAGNALFGSYLIRTRPDPDIMVPHFAATFFGSALGTSIKPRNAILVSDRKINLSTSAIISPLLPFRPTHSEQRAGAAIVGAPDRNIGLRRGKCAVPEEPIETLLLKLTTGDPRVGELELTGFQICALSHTPTAQPKGART